MIGALLMLAVSAGAAHVHTDEKPINCGSCAAWNGKHAPFKLHGNSYYVGVDGLSAVLITTPKGHFLIDGGLPQSAQLIRQNIQSLGFDIRDVKWLLNSHAHFDHAGGLAALQRMSGAPVAASGETVASLKIGQALSDDPQYAPDNTMAFPAVTSTRVIRDGETLVLGNITITAHDTPGHAPGGNSWSWKSCEAGRCVTLVYADSLSAVSEPDYRYGDHPTYLKAFRHSIAKIRALDCDILVSAHPEFSNLFEREKTDSLIDAMSCRKYADAAGERLDKRLKQERSH
ncbi:MAG: subclass B3 metallo-beta-lactamase [Arenimonas sp.]